MVPCTIVPFFNSMVTVSPPNFIRNLQNNNKNKDFNVKFTFSSNKSESTSSKRKRLIKDLASNILELNILRTKAEQLENEIKTMSMDRFDSNVAEVNK